MSATTRGFNKLAARFERAAAEAEPAAEAKMNEIGPELMALSQAVAPYLEGDLRDAAYSKVSGGSGGPELEVGYEGLPYLIVQENGFFKNFKGTEGYVEISQYTTPGTGSHFLSGPFAAERDRYVQEIGKAAIGPLLKGE